MKKRFRQGTACVATLIAFVANAAAPSTSSEQDPPSSEHYGGTSWPQLQNTPQRTGFTPEEVAPPLAGYWKYAVQPDRIARCHQAIVSGGKVFVGTKKGVVLALAAHPADPKNPLLWAKPLGGGIFQTLATDGKRVFATNLDGNIYALDCQTGEIVWKLDTGFGISAGVLLAEGRIFAGNREGRFVALDKDTGSLAWEQELGAPCFMTAAYNDPSAGSGQGGRIYVGAEDMKMRAFAAGTGELLWTGPRLYGDSFHPYFPVVHAGQVFVRTKPGGEIMAYGRGASADGYTGCPSAFKVEDGKVVMAQDTQEARVAFLGEHPWLQRMYALDEKTGEQTRILFHMASTPSLGFGTVAPPSVDRDGLLIVGITYAAPNDGWASTKFGRMDPMTGLVTLPLPPEIAGNPDECVGSSCAGRFVMITHSNPSGGAFTDGVVDLEAGKAHPNAYACRSQPWLSAKSPVLANNNEISVNPAVVADGILVRIQNHTILALKSAEGE